MEEQVLKILKKVELLRNNNNLSQQQMADLMEISQSKYARFESGRSKTDLKTLLLFCEKIKIPIEEFFIYPNKPNTNEIEAIIQIKLKDKQKETILKQLVGKEDLEILNK